MSGHSKWSTIKRQKGAADMVRGQLFTKLGNAITIAVREGGGVADPGSNIRLRLAIDKARAANMPKDNIERAIDKATGKLAGSISLETVLYEGFAPGGVAILVEGVTDNKQRTAAAVKNIFSTAGGNLSGSGSVAYLFEKVGVVTFISDRSQEEMLSIILDASALDFELEEGNSYNVYTTPNALHETKVQLEKAGLLLKTVELSYRPTTLINIDKAIGNKVITLLTRLETLDDVQKVHANFTIDTATE